MRYNASSGQILLVIESCNHWVLLFASPDWGHSGGLRWLLFDGLPENVDYEIIAMEVAEVAIKLTALLLQTFDGMHRGVGIAQLEPTTCGTVAIANAAKLLGFGEVSDSEIMNMHGSLLELQGTDPSFTAMGIEQSFQTLRKLLAEKGVPKMQFKLAPS